MAVEIERKFLVNGDEWRKQAVPHRIVQGFLSRDPDRIVRVRVAGDNAYLTIKGRANGLSRAEFEFPIEVSLAQDLLQICLPTIIEKSRHKLGWGGVTWEIDEFHGANSGLIVAEVELPQEDTAFEMPPWIGAEVSFDYRYTNSQLSEHPFTTWIMDERSANA